MRPLIWFRSDLRTLDNTALHQACRAADGGAVAIFTLAPAQWKSHDWGANRVGYLLENLRALSARLARLNIPLKIVDIERFSAAPAALLDVVRRHGCDVLHLNREYELNEARRDEAVLAAFKRAGIEAHAWHDQTLLPPDAVKTGGGTFYTIFTPYRTAWLKELSERGAAACLSEPKKVPPIPDLKSDEVPGSIDGFAPPTCDLTPWTVGGQASLKRLEAFIAGPVRDYRSQRDLPAAPGVSALSPCLALGMLSPRQCLAAAGALLPGRAPAPGMKFESGPAVWISQLIWREFFRHVMVGFPRISMGQPFRLQTRKLKWSHDEQAFERWKAGRTGVPIVDAGMRQLAAEGWMHNRLRMIVAMYLVKDLFIDWRWGERWFMDQLLDGDLASNNGSWQWAASTGTDAAPYFRIFNPVTQSRRFDPEGRFIRRYCPELAELDDKMIHDPSRLPPLARARLDYPEPLVDHDKARLRTIEAFKALK